MHFFLASRPILCSSTNIAEGPYSNTDVASRISAAILALGVRLSSPRQPTLIYNTIFPHCPGECSSTNGFWLHIVGSFTLPVTFSIPLDSGHILESGSEFRK